MDYKIRYLELLKRIELGNLPSKEELNLDLRILGESFLDERNLVDALSVYKKLNDREKIKEIGERCFQKKFYFDAVLAFEFLNDREGIFRVIKSTDQEGDVILYDALKSYIGEKTTEKLITGFNKWSSERGFENAIPSLTKTLNMVYHLVRRYDFGVGITKGGLFLTYLFNLLGLNTKLVNSHRKGRGATFSWCDTISSNEIKNKKIAIFDKDVVSGRTTNRVLREIQSYNPKQIDLILNIDPVSGNIGIGTISSNISKGYTNIYSPIKFRYDQFDKVIENLEQRLENG